MAKIGVLGLGVIGSRISKHLINAGYQVVVYDVRNDAVESFRDLAIIATSARHLGALSDTVLLTLPSPKEVYEVLFNPDGVVHGLRSGGIVINLSTVGPKAAVDFWRQLRQYGIKYVDAAVTAPYMGYLAAERGDLTIMVGCDDIELFNEVQGVLRSFSRKVVYTGSVGTAQVVKLANNIMSAVAYLGVIEGTLWAVKHGVDPKVVYEVVKDGSGDSWALRNRLPRLLEGDFNPGFKTGLMLKDVSLFLEEAKELRMFTPVVSLVHQLIQAAMALGLEELDWGSVVKVYETINKVRVTPSEVMH